ncbi:MAG: TRAP transporter small permease subunit [Bacteroidota bacterium]
MPILEKTTNFINQLNERVGRGVAWLTTILVIVIFIDVIFRYSFEETATWVIDLEWHLFAIIFLLGGGYAYRHDKHVRVDLFYAKFSKRDQALVNLLGALLLLVPWCLAVIWFSGEYAQLAFQIREGSPDPGGLPARYLIKSVVVVGFFLLLLQALSVILNAWKILRETEDG